MISIIIQYYGINEFCLFHLLHARIQVFFNELGLTIISLIKHWQWPNGWLKEQTRAYVLKRRVKFYGVFQGLSLIGWGGGVKRLRCCSCEFFKLFLLSDSNCDKTVTFLAFMKRARLLIWICWCMRLIYACSIPVRFPHCRYNGKILHCYIYLFFYSVQLHGILYSIMWLRAPALRKIPNSLEELWPLQGFNFLYKFEVELSNRPFFI